MGISKTQEHPVTYIRGTQTYSYIRGTQTYSYIRGTQTYSYIRGTQTYSYIRGTQTYSYIRGTQTYSYTSSCYFHTLICIDVKYLLLGDHLVAVPAAEARRVPILVDACQEPSKSKRTMTTSTCRHSYRPAEYSCKTKLNEIYMIKTLTGYFQLLRKKSTIQILHGQLSRDKTLTHSANTWLIKRSLN